ncbi:hypothetical protein [Naumannella huperziae]
MKVDRVLWCTGDTETAQGYRQMESTDPVAVKALALPSYRETNPTVACPADGSTKLDLFVAVDGGEQAWHIAAPSAPCGDFTSEFANAVESAEWIRSVEQPSD